MNQIVWSSIAKIHLKYKPTRFQDREEYLMLCRDLCSLTIIILLVLEYGEQTRRAPESYVESLGPSSLVDEFICGDGDIACEHDCVRVAPVL